MFKLEFTPKGQKDLEKLPKNIQIKVIKKLELYSKQTDPLVFAKSLVNLPPTTHRFRLGDYRIAFYIKGTIIYIERVKHRREVYYLEIRPEN